MIHCCLSGPRALEPESPEAQEIFRAAAVLKRLRRFVERGPLQAQWVDARDIIAEGATLGMLAVRQAGAELKVSIAPDLGELWIDAIQIQQVLLNLALNAMDAVAEAPDDRRTIVLSVRTSEWAVEIRVTDRGHGVQADQLPKLFDSFYTTKRQGMGLGLSIARTLVEAHSGRIWVESWPGERTTFHVELPIAGAKVASATENR